MKRRFRTFLKASLPISDVRRRRAFQRRIDVLYAILFVCLLIIIARLMELQIIRGREYEDLAHKQHFGGIELPAKRGEIFSRNSKTGEKNVLATNTTLDLLYVDPFVTKDKRAVADVLGKVLLTAEFDQLCRNGHRDCPREFRKYYSVMFDPVTQDDAVAAQTLRTYDQIVQAFSHSIEQRISEEFVSFVPLLYGANKVQIRTVNEYGIPGVYASEEQKIIYVNPLQIPDFELERIARILASLLNADVSVVKDSLRKRRLRYVPILRKLPPAMSKEVKKLKEESVKRTAAERLDLLTRGRKDEADRVEDPLRGIALIQEHWRMYPDGTVASQVVGFVRDPPPGLSLTVKEQPQSGIERVFDYELHGQHGEISTVVDPFGGQIFSDDQMIKQARDGRSVVLTIDRYLQKQVETILQKAVEEYQADSAQVVIMDPSTGRVIVMANAPLSDSNNYSGVFEKVSFAIPPEREPAIVVEVYNPQSNALVVRGYLNDLTPEGRVRLSKELQQTLYNLEQVYNLDDLKRYYYYLGNFSRIELFPVCSSGNSPSTGVPRLLESESQDTAVPPENTPSGCTWLRYKNGIGIGAYVNRAVQEIYEPGSVFKPITMSIAIDQGEVMPEDIYVDEGSVVIDEYVIENANRRIFGELTMTDCLSFSVNTCMTSVSRKLGKKLFANYIRRFGLGKITGIQLEDEKPGNILDWRRWSDALLATAAFGQGISATPIQIATAFSALANGGKLMKPTIVDSWIEPDGTEHQIHPQIVEQVITEETAATVTAMLTRGMNEGFAKKAKVLGHRMAGKTGTSQIAKPGGGYEETGTGSAITSFAGFAPVNHPKFVMLVKFDRPRAREYGENTAAPVFKDIATILFEYYGIPSDEQ